jgi:hypothetical protein
LDLRFNWFFTFGNWRIFEFKSKTLMKKTLIPIALILTMGIFSCKNQEADVPKTTYEVVGEAEVVPGNYGDIIEVAQVSNLAEMVSQVEADGTFDGKISGEIKEVCTKKGCWFAMELPNGQSMRVTFKDYGFFIPTNSQGFPIVIQGVATLSDTDVETLKHFAEDQGKSKEEVEAITEPKKEITFEATGVVIKSKA